MEKLNALREAFPDAAKDIKLNLAAVFEGGELSPAQRWGTALACAYASRNAALTAALLADARPHLSDDVIEDAKAAAVLMAMNNVFYRFRHFVGKEVYQTKAARLRMNRLVQVKTSKTDMELFCLAVSALNGCETCVKAHEKVVLEAGLSEDQVMDAIRIAAVVHAAALATELS
jgi:alkyl hydroperoxide reductase subunit D